MFRVEPYPEHHDLLHHDGIEPSKLAWLEWLG
jgi:hypothetical protein